MSPRLSERMLPVQETAKSKSDVLDFSRIDTTQPCALEFRPHVTFTRREHIAMLAMLVVASTVAMPAAWLVGTFSDAQLWRWQFGVAAILLGVILAAGNQLAQVRQSQSGLPKVDATTIFCLCSPPLGWLAAALTSRVFDLAGAFFFLAVAVPATIMAADHIATNAIHWMTANTLVDHATQTEWREDWARRFLCAPRLELSDEEAECPQLRAIFQAAVRARRDYAIGFVWLLAGFILPTAFILIASRPANMTTIGLQIVVGMMFGALIAGILRSGGRTATVSRFWSALAHWFHYGKGDQKPPWMFQSPYGGHCLRRVIVLIAVGLLSVVIAGLAQHSFVRLALAAATTTLNTDMEYSASASIESGVDVDILQEAPLARPEPWLWIPATLVVSGIVVPVVFLLNLWILIGPTLDAYYKALEA